MKTRLSLALVIALAAAAPADAAAVKYVGKTSQNLTIKIKLKGGSIDSLLVYVKNDCGATKKPIEVGGPIEIADDGRFNAGLGDGAFTIGGRFKDDRVTGKLRERVADPIGGGTCDTKKVTFAATR